MEKLKTIDWRREGRQLVRDYLLVMIGALVTAVSFSWFFLPYDVAPGGVTGIATVLSSLTGLSVGLLSFLINVPLFLTGWRQVGWRFAVRSFVAMGLLSVFIDLLPPLNPAGDIMLATVFGGVLLGVGLGIVVRAGATTGGTDMAAKMIHRLAGFLSIATILFIIDATVVLIAAMAFGIQAGLWALIALFISSKTMDVVIKGFNTAMQFLIITREPEEIVRRIHGDLDRGCTRIKAYGTYSGEEMGTLLCVVARTEAARLKKVIAEADPNAFVTVCDVHEALGEGFTGMEQE